MIPTDEYRSKADQCEDLANIFGDGEIQKTLQRVAEKLRKLAEKTEQSTPDKHVAQKRAVI